MFYGLLSHRMPFPDLCPAHSPGAGAGGDLGIHYARAEAHFRRGVLPLRQSGRAVAGSSPQGTQPGGTGAQAGVSPKRRRVIQ